MLGILKTIFGAGDIVSKGMDLADKMHTSTEEEIQAKNQAKVNVLKAYAPFKITQRILAILFASVFVLSFFLVLIMALIQIGNIKDVFLVLDAFYIGEIMLSIVLFYFGGGVAEGIIEKTTDKARESRARLVQNMNGSESSLVGKPHGRRQTDPNPPAFEDN